MHFATQHQTMAFAPASCQASALLAVASKSSLELAAGRKGWVDFALTVPPPLPILHLAKPRVGSRRLLYGTLSSRDGLFDILLSYVANVCPSPLG